MFRNNLDKKGWLKIVEAFIGVIMIAGVVLTMMTRPGVSDSSVQQETVKLEKFILDRIVADPVLRSQVLAGDTSGINKVFASSVPAGISYSVRICNYNEVCALGMVVPYDVYTQEALVASNLTYYDPQNVKMIRVFFWHGPWPEGACPSFCTEGEQTKSCSGNNLVTQTCVRNSSTCLFLDPGSSVDCSATGKYCDGVSGSCMKAIARLNVVFTNTPIYKWYNTNPAGWTNRSNWTISISETAGIDWYIDTYVECWKVKPTSWISNCNEVNPPSPIKVDISNPFIKTNGYFYTDVANNLGNLTYRGHDINNNFINTPTYSISFS